MKKISILIHGYSKTQRDMYTLAKNLEKLDHTCIIFHLPLTYKEIDYATNVFKEKLERVIKNLDENQQVNLIGHSTGGLIIRKYLLNTSYSHKIKSCVLIATPNNGSVLADYVFKHFPMVTKTFKTLKSLQTENVQTIRWDRKCNIPIGAIAGCKNTYLLGKLLPDKSDGRVRVESVYHKCLKDFIILSYGHKDIHYQWETAKYINHFIETFRFK